MSPEQNKRIVRDDIDRMWNQGDSSVVDELYSPNFVMHDPASPADVRGRDGMKEFIAMYRTAYPDMHFEVEAQVAEGDMVVSRWTVHGTHRGALAGMAPTGRAITVTGMTLTRFQDDLIAESWTNWDTLGMMRQLGAVPEHGMAHA